MVRSPTGVFAALCADLMRGLIEAAKADLAKWFAGLLIAQAARIATRVKLL